MNETNLPGDPPWTKLTWGYCERSEITYDLCGDCSDILGDFVDTRRSQALNKHFDITPLEAPTKPKETK